MDIRIGIANSPREISFETSQSASDIEQQIASALDSESRYVKLTDDKGRVYLVPTSTLAYVEIGAEESRRVGFVA